MMLQGGNPNVLWIYGLYEGCLGDARHQSQVGLVMEFMSRGSLADLLKKLDGPPPWPLTFRITHQIGVGMNFLHKLDPPLLHLDLKPSNVLLDDSLNAKLTDFGLSRVARSLSKSVREKDEVEGGTLSYMPPEALKSVNYKPNKASDIYSYGVLLWSIITGKEPYIDAPSSLVRFRIPEGDRPEMTSIDCSKAEGLDDIVKLISTCWTQEPKQRPSFRDCVHVTEKVLDMHKRGVNDAVHVVLKRLDDDICSSLESVQITPKPQNRRPQVLRGVTGPSPQQETVASQNTEGIKKEFVPHPVHFKTTQHQTSRPGGNSISLSNVSGVQIGNNNYMNITERSRQRHRTAPSSINGSHYQTENSYKKTESQPYFNTLLKKEKK